MSASGSNDARHEPGSRSVLKRVKGWSRSCENGLLSTSLALMVVLPVLEIVLRKFFGSGVSGSSSWVQHLTLIVGMLGGAVAAREARLLSLGTAVTYLKGAWKSVATVFTGGFAAAITAFLCGASIEFWLTEKEADKVLAYGIPFWVLELALPLGFAAVALRLIWHAAPSWRGRVTALLLAGAFVVVGWWAPISPEELLWPALAMLLIATILGAPIFVTLGGAAVILYWSEGQTIAGMPIDHYRLVTNPSLPTIPLFTLAGYFLAEGGASRRLIRVFQALVGGVRGGPAIVTALVCAFFTSFTGASGVTILALGGLLLPVLLAARYSERTSLGLLTGAGSLGLLLPPCLPVILYAIIANTSARANITIEQMFLAGTIPGFLMIAMTAAWGVWGAPKLAKHERRFDVREAIRALWDAKWELLIPAVALGTLFSGWVTIVEAAAITALYAFVVETFIYRDLPLRRSFFEVMVECGLLVGGVLLILGVALGFTNYLVDAQVAMHLLDWATETIQSRWLFLLMLNLFLIVVGCLMDIYAATIVVVPLLVPLGNAFGIDPLHLGVIFLANLQLGYLTPPVGMNLFLASYRFGKPMSQVIRASLPMLGVLALGVALITYVPWLTTFLPRLFGK